MMYALFIVLNKTDYLEDILSAFVRLGVEGATILDSQGMASAIINGQIENIPLFGSLKNIIEGSHPFNKTIFSVIENEELVDKVALAVKEVMGDSLKPGGGFMFSVPVNKVYNLDDKK
jgi:nitrogen regulatory protein PII